MPCKFSIILLNYNGKKYIDNLFRSLQKLESQGFSYEIIFVDNDSKDDSVAYLEQNYQKVIPSLKIVKSGANLGFAGGNNYGVKFAEGEYLIFLNNDTAVPENWLNELSTFIVKKPQFGMISSKLVFFYDFIQLNIQTQDKIFFSTNIKINGQKYRIDPKFTKNVLYGDKEITGFGHTTIYIPLLQGTDKSYEIEFDDLRIHNEQTDRWILGEQAILMGRTITLNQEYVSSNKLTLIQNAGSGVNEKYDGYDIGFCEVDQGQYDKIVELDSCCGAAMLISKDLFEKVGGFDHRFFMYYEDTDLAYRVKREGLKLYLCPTAVVRHIHTGSSQEWSPFFVYQIYRNKLLFIFKNFPFSVFVKQFIKYVLHVGREVFTTRQKASLKKSKVKAIFGFLKLSPHYIGSVKIKRGAR